MGKKIVCNLLSRKVKSLNLSVPLCLCFSLSLSSLSSLYSKQQIILLIVNNYHSLPINYSLWFSLYQLSCWDMLLLPIYLLLNAWGYWLISRDILSIDMIMRLCILFKLLWCSCSLNLFVHSRILFKSWLYAKGGDE